MKFQGENRENSQQGKEGLLPFDDNFHKLPYNFLKCFCKNIFEETRCLNETFDNVVANYIEDWIWDESIVKFGKFYTG